MPYFFLLANEYVLVMAAVRPDRYETIHAVAVKSCKEPGLLVDDLDASFSGFERN